MFGAIELLGGLALLGDANGRPRFGEEGAHGCMTLEVVEDVPGARLATRIADEELPFGGTWT